MRLLHFFSVTIAFFLFSCRTTGDNASSLENKTSSSDKLEKSEASIVCTSPHEDSREQVEVYLFKTDKIRGSHDYRAEYVLNGKKNVVSKIEMTTTDEYGSYDWQFRSIGEDFSKGFFVGIPWNERTDVKKNKTWYSKGSVSLSIDGPTFKVGCVGKYQ